MLDPVPSGLGTVLQSCRQWVCWLQEHAELAAALTDYVCAAAEVLLDLRDVQPDASQAAYAKAVSAACVAGAAVFESQDRFPLFEPGPVSILRLATLMYTSSSSPLRSLLTRQALLKALAGQQHAQQHQGQQVQALAMLPAQAAEWLVLPEDDAAALRARASSLLQERAFDQFDACMLAAGGAEPVQDLGLAAHVEFIDFVRMWMAKIRDPVLAFNYRRAAPLPPLPPWNSEEQPKPDLLTSEDFTVSTARFEHTAVRSQLKQQQQYLEAALSSDLPAEVVLCYRATRTPMYRRYARLRESDLV